MNELFNIASGGNFTLFNIVVNLGLTIVLSFAIALVYKKTHRGLSYSQSFLSTLILLSVITTIAMMVIGNSLAIAFGLLGAFSIIRFRTPVKEAKDTGYIFFSLVEGMAVGTNSHLIAIVSTIVVLAIIWILHKSNFGAMHKNEYLLVFTVDYQKQQPDNFAGIFEKYFKNSMLLNISAKENRHKSEMVYSVSFFDEAQTNKLIHELMLIDGVSDARVISSKSDIEY
jgi:uncharacterized membrane protein YhiD involved in acid resistance